MSGKIRVSLVIALSIGALLALALFFGRSDTIRADTPLVVSPQASSGAEDAGAITVTLPASHAGDGVANGNCIDMTYVTTPAASTATANGDLSALSAVACTDTTNPNDTDADTIDWTPDTDFHSDVTELSAAINASVTIIPVDSTADFAAAGTVLIESEFISYTAKTATELTGATRGAHLSSAATHADALAVTEAVEEFTFTAAHIADESSSVSVLIAVTAVNDVPVVCGQPTAGGQVAAGCTEVTDAFATGTGVDGSITLLALDVDGCDSTAFTFDTTTSVTPTSGTLSPTTGSMTCSGDGVLTSGVLTYSTTLATFNGTDTFDFLVNDTVGDSAPLADIDIDVNATPVAQAQSLTTDKNTVLAITLTGTDADPTLVADCELTFVDANPSFGATTAPAAQTCSIDASGTDTVTLTYTPVVDFVGTDSFTFTVQDGSGASNNLSTAATITITVGEAPTPTVSGTATVLAGSKIVIVNDPAFTSTSVCFATLQDYPGNIANVRYCGLGLNSSAPLTAPNFYIVLTEGPDVNITVGYQIVNP